ncbi:hypothetical protein [Streptomyces sp. NPDC051001]
MGQLLEGGRVKAVAEEKLTQLDAALKPSVIHLGLPTFGQIARRSNTL